MLPRPSRLAFLLAICGIIALAYVVSGGSRIVKYCEHIPTQTHAPARSDDSAWQTASCIDTTNGSSAQFGKHHARATPSRIFERPRRRALSASANSFNTSHDRSPLHSIPLLI
jgi:hypothetical protein